MLCRDDKTDFQISDQGLAPHSGLEGRWIEALLISTKWKTASHQSYDCHCVLSCVIVYEATVRLSRCDSSAKAEVTLGRGAFVPPLLSRHKAPCVFERGLGISSKY